MSALEVILKVCGVTLNSCSSFFLETQVRCHSCLGDSLLFVDLVLINVGQAGVRIIPQNVWLLACADANPYTKIPGPVKGVCIVIVFTAFSFDILVSFLALVHFSLALIMCPFCCGES